MSVLIKGMEMPTSCDDCFLPLRFCPYAMKPDGECPLVPVPPHGRLIDADAMYRKMFVGPDGMIYPNNDADNWPHTMTLKEVKHHILFAPTVIDADA